MILRRAGVEPLALAGEVVAPVLVEVAPRAPGAAIGPRSAGGEVGRSSAVISAAAARRHQAAFQMSST